MVWKMILATVLLLGVTACTAYTAAPAETTSFFGSLNWPTASIIASIFFGILAVLWRILPEKKKYSNTKSNQELDTELNNVKDELSQIKNNLKYLRDDFNKEKTVSKEGHDRIQKEIEHLEYRVDKILNFFVEHIQRNPNGWKPESD